MTIDEDKNYKTKLFAESFWGRNCIGIIDAKKYEELLNEGLSDWNFNMNWDDLCNFYKKNKESFLFGHQINNLYLNVNKDGNIKKIINLIEETPNGKYFDNNEKLISESCNKHKYKFKRESKIIDKMEINSGRMSFFCPLEHKYSSHIDMQCENGTYLLKRVSYSKDLLPPIKMRMEEFDVNFNCCKSSKKLSKDLIKQVGKLPKYIYCKKCEKSLGGINDKKSLLDYLLYKGKEYEVFKYELRDRTIIEGLEELRNINRSKETYPDSFNKIPRYFEVIEREDKGLIGNKAKIMRKYSAVDEGKFHKI